MANIYQTLVVILTAILALASSDEAGTILKLTDANMDAMLATYPFLFVKFFAPWCGHCKNMAEDYENLAKSFSKHSQSIRIAELNGDEAPSSAQKYNIEGYPTLLLFKKGADQPTPLPDNTPRTLQGMSEFLSRETKLTGAPIAAPPSFVSILSSDSFDRTLQDKCALVDFYAPWCGHCKTLNPIYEKLAFAFRAEPTVVIGKVDCTVHPDLGERFSIGGYPTIKFFQGSTSSPQADYREPRDLKSLVNYINSKCRTSRNVDGTLTEAFARSKEAETLIVQFMASSSPQEKKDLLKKVEKATQNLSRQEYVKFYTTYMTRVLEKGPSYVAAELERIEGLLAQQDRLDPQTLDSFTVRRRILKVFAGQLSPVEAEHEEL